MFTKLNTIEDSALYFFYATVTLPLFHPFVYLKNIVQHQLPICLKPRVIFRGIIPAWMNYSVLISCQSGLTNQIASSIRKSKYDTSNVSDFQLRCFGAVTSAILLSIWVSPTELATIQQQNFGISLSKFLNKITVQYGVQKGLFRGFVYTALRECIFCFFL